MHFAGRAYRTCDGLEMRERGINNDTKVWGLNYVLRWVVLVKKET